MTKLVRAFSLVALVMVAGSAYSDEASDIRAINAMYRKLERAFFNKDLKGVMAIGTSDFSWVGVDGQAVPGAQVQKMLAEQFAMPGVKMLLVSMTGDSFGFMGNECRVRNVTSMVMSMKQGGNTMKMKGYSECVDTWRRTPKGWRVCKVEIVYERNEPG